MSTHRPLLLVGAAGVLVSAYPHCYLYFWGGYRGISIDRVLGVDISRSFALNAIAGLVIADRIPKRPGGSHGSHVRRRCFISRNPPKEAS